MLRVNAPVTHQYRIIPIDGREHTPLEQLDGTWKGESIGHWEGDTMVVDTIGFNDTSWLDIGGYFHSENMRVIERIRREGNTLTWQATVEDPDVLIKPWVMNPRVLKLNPDPKAVLEESLPCVERDLSHLVKAATSPGTNPYRVPASFPAQRPFLRREPSTIGVSSYGVLLMEPSRRLNGPARMPGSRKRAGPLSSLSLCPLRWRKPR